MERLAQYVNQLTKEKVVFKVHANKDYAKGIPKSIRHLDVSYLMFMDEGYPVRFNKALE